MNIMKKQAIKKIEKIQSDSGINREKFPKNMIGKIALDNWDNGLFSLGMEYGYILALLDIFKIRMRNLK